MPAVDDQRSPLRAVRGLGMASMILIGIVTLLGVLLAAEAWTSYDTLVGFAQGTGPTQDDAIAAIQTYRIVYFLIEVAALATGIVFLIWLWRARINAEILGGPDSQRRGRGWTIGGWLCPIVNFWFPYRIVTDIYRVSTGRRADPSPVVRLWWAVTVVGESVSFVVAFAGAFTGDPQSALHTWAISLTIDAASQVVTGILIILIVKQISDGQVENPPVTDVVGL